MADALVKLALHPRAPAAVSPGRWEPGDVIEVREEGGPLGDLERPPACILVTLPQLTVAQAEALLLEPHPEGIARRRRRFPQSDVDTWRGSPSRRVRLNLPESALEGRLEAVDESNAHKVEAGADAR